MDFSACIAALAGAAAKLAPEDILPLLETPPDPTMGDFALPCFTLAKALRRPPQAIAADLASRIDLPDWLSRVIAAGPYLNFYINRAFFTRQTLTAVQAAGEVYGNSNQGAGRTVCIDYSSINIAKRFHIGHLSTTAIGHALYRIYGALGYRCVGINHLGDWGTQFGKMIAAYKHWGDRATVEAGGVNEMVRLYVRFHEEAEKTPALEDEGRAWFKRIEDNDPEAMEIFTWFKQVTLQDAQRTYDLLGITFDSYAGESFYNDKMGRVLTELTDKGLLQDSQGAKIVDLTEYDMPPCLILKSDGATLYTTRDIAAALYRQDTYHFDKCLYVVAYQQNLHFRQWFKVVELMGYPWAKDLEHVAFGMVSYEGQALATRTGHVIYLDELLERAIEKAQAIITEKNPDLPDQDVLARQVGVGSVIFTALFNNRIKDIDFWWDRALNFDGETAPYVQYAHARCCSLMEKAAQSGLSPADTVKDDSLADDDAYAVCRLLADFPGIVEQAAQRNEPYLITRFTIALAQAFNKFYFEHRILDAPPDQAAARLALTDCVRRTLKRALWLIGIDAPQKM